MCLFTTYPSRHGVTDAPRHRSNFSAHPPPGVVRIPRGSTVSYQRRSETSFRDGDRVVEYRRSRSRSRPRTREIEYIEDHHHHHPRSSARSFVGVEENRRRSVSRVRY